MAWIAKSWHFAFVIGLAAPLVGSCGMDESDADGAPQNGSDEDDDDKGGNGGTSKDAGSKASDASLPPEVEQQLTFETPQAGKSSVYVADPTSNRVAVVNANTFNVENIAVGTNPKYVATVPGQDVAIVLNVGTQDAALLRTSDQGVTQAPKRLAIGHDANSIAIAPDALHALVFFNAAASTTTTTDSFQDLSVIDLAAGVEQVRRVSVGFKPRAVQFSEDSKRAFVITEDGISILDFAALDQGPKILPLVALGDGLSDAQSIDVQVTPDGKYALARRNGESVVRLIDLGTSVISRLTLGTSTGLDAGVPDGGSLTAELTDLDLSPDGTFAVAVLRDRGVLVRIPIPQGFTDATLLKTIPAPDALVGSVVLSASGTRAVAYTTAADVQSVTVFDLTSDALPRGIRLRKGVRAVAVSDDGTRLLVLHNVSANAGGSAEDQRIQASNGYSLVDTGSGFAKLQLTAVPVSSNGLLLTPDGKRVFALLASDSVKSVEMADLDSFQVISRDLSTRPNSIGFVPGVGVSRVFVGQTGSGGITFLDAVTGAAVRTVSGFEIASRIRQ